MFKLGMSVSFFAHRIPRRGIAGASSCYIPHIQISLKTGYYNAVNLKNITFA